MRYAVPAIIPAFACAAFALTYVPYPEWGRASSIPDYTAAQMQEIDERAEKNLAEAERNHRFRRRMAEVKRDLRMGCLTLSDAAAELNGAATADNPFFLRLIADRFPQLPARERLAVLLIDHLSLEVGYDLAQTNLTRLDALMFELQHWQGVTSLTLAAADAVRKYHCPTVQAPTQ